ncbi:MAG: PfkB family carbohydrate kinase [Candidatus Omnitrophica bacterium]|nr:PfkB family carbohydrate kinase [Candidatus Omnitrophota bacterium]
MAILVVGSVALDTIETPFGLKREVLGGSATYFSLAGRFFHPVRIVAVAGKDMSKEKLFLLRKRNIDLKGLKIKKGKTFRWWGRYGNDFNHRQTIKLELNVFEKFSPRLAYPYNRTPFVFLANIDPVLQKKILGQIKGRRFVGSDTIDHWIRNKPDDLLLLLKKTDVFFINNSEAELFSQRSNIYQAARWLAGKGPEVVVIKKGEQGALMFCGNRFFSCPAFPVKEVVDPTGAGDAFAGGFMGYIASYKRVYEREFRRAVVCGTVMGSFAVESFGPQRLLDLKISPSDLFSKVAHKQKS